MCKGVSPKHKNKKEQNQKLKEMTIYQLNTKGNKVPKLVGSDLNKGLEMLYKGLDKQNKVGKRFLNLSKGRPIFIEGMNKSGYLVTQNIVPANWSIEQAREAIAYLLGK